MSDVFTWTDNEYVGNVFHITGVEKLHWGLFQTSTTEWSIDIIKNTDTMRCFIRREEYRKNIAIKKGDLEFVEVRKPQKNYCGYVCLHFKQQIKDEDKLIDKFHFPFDKRPKETDALLNIMVYNGISISQL